jgi:hypothetical protein
VKGELEMDLEKMKKKIWLRRERERDRTIPIKREKSRAIVFLGIKVLVRDKTVNLFFRV